RSLREKVRTACRKRAEEEPTHDRTDTSRAESAGDVRSEARRTFLSAAEDDPEPCVTLRFELPLPVAAALDEARGLFHAIVGGRASRARFLETPTTRGQQGED